MPFVRVSRDKRGYEHVFLVDVQSRQGRPSRARVLYWFRTPPGVKLGRQAFDPDVRRRLEAKYPEIRFDWDQLSNLPVAPPDVEHWRERRRAERAAKEAAKAERAQSAARADGEDGGPAVERPLPPSPPAVAPAPVGVDAQSATEGGEGGAAPSQPASTAAATEPTSAVRKRRRHRRRGRGRGAGQTPESTDSTPPSRSEPAE